MNNKELFKNKVKLATNNLIKTINIGSNVKTTSKNRIKIPYNELVRDVFGSIGGSSISNNKQTFKNLFDAKNTNSLKPMMKQFQKGAVKR